MHQDFHVDDLFFTVFLLCSLYFPFRDFSCTFCPATVVSVTVCLVVLGAHFSSEIILYFLLLSDVFFLPALCLSGFVCLPAVAYCGCRN